MSLFRSPSLPRPVSAVDTLHLVAVALAAVAAVDMVAVLAGSALRAAPPAASATTGAQGGAVPSRAHPSAETTSPASPRKVVDAGPPRARA